MPPLTQEQIDTGSLDFRLNNRIHIGHYRLLAEMLNEPWDWLFTADSDIMRGRIESGSLMAAAYADKKPDDEIKGVDLTKYNGSIPIILLETVAIRTGGDYEGVPKLYSALTNHGLWERPVEDPDTLIMVDLTAIPSRRGRRGQGEVGHFMGFVKALIGAPTDYELMFDSSPIFPFDLGGIEHVWTYSPVIGGVIRMHERYGATNTGFRIENARLVPEERITDPNFNHDLMHVNMMSYKG